MIEEIARRMGEKRAIEIIADLVASKKDRITITIPIAPIDELIEQCKLDYSKLYGSYDAFEITLTEEFNRGFINVCRQYKYNVVHATIG